ncbi:MAG: hypothetical protein ABEH88_08850 [Halobacteriales archaeon]
MGIIRSLLAFVVVILFTTSLVAGNAVVAVDRTAANEEFVKTTLEEEGAYRTIQSVASEEAAAQIEDVDLPAAIINNTREDVNDTLERAYLKDQTEANIERVFAFLEGDRDRLNVSVDLTPVKENFTALIEDRIANTSRGELLDIVAENDDLSTEVAGEEISLKRTIANMSKNETLYNREKARVRDRAINRAVNESYDESVANEEYDPLLGLVIEDYNPNNYTKSEKADLVQERETEIKAELEAEARAGSDTVNVDQRLREINEQAKQSANTTVENSLSGTEFEPAAGPATEMAAATIDGLTTNQSYAEYTSRMSAAQTDLAAEVSTVVRNRLDEQVEDRFNLLRNDQISDAERADIRNAADNARDGYGSLDLSMLLFPLISIGLIGVLYLITRSFPATAVLSGIPALLVGGGTYAVASAAPGEIDSEVRSELQGSEVPEKAIDLILGITDQVLGVVAQQSLVIALVGVGLIVAGIIVSVQD